MRALTVVTGGGRGIGAATALHLARAGHDVVIGYLSDHTAADEVVSAALGIGVRALAVAGDVASEADVERLFSAAADLGTVTGLVNNAGLTAHIGDLANTPAEVVRRVVEVNLLGTLLCSRRAVQLMSTARGGAGGAIVNVSSTAATLGSAHDYVHYAAAKAGVDALTVGLAKELGDQGVRVKRGGARHGAHGPPCRSGRSRPARPGATADPARTCGRAG